MALQKPRNFTRARGARGLIFIEWLAVLVAASVADMCDPTANGLCAKAVQLLLRGPLYSHGALFSKVVMARVRSQGSYIKHADIVCCLWHLYR